MIRKVLNREDCFLYARIQKVHGIHGELRLILEDEFPISPEEPGFLFLDVEGGIIPYAVEHIKSAGPRSIIVKLTDVPGVEAAKRLSGMAVYLPSGLLSGNNALSDLQHVLVGYMILDADQHKLGRVKEVVMNPHQQLMIVEAGGGEVMVPLAAELVISMDKKRRQLVMDLPEGLADLNI